MAKQEFTNINGIYVCDQTARDNMPTKTSQLENDSNFVTDSVVDEKISNAQLGGGEVDLSGYVTKELGNANQITFSDGETFQTKLDAGTLKGDKGDTGATYASGVSITDEANNFTSNNVEGALAELFQSVSNGKTLIASAITDKGVVTSNTDDFQTMATNISNIEGVSSISTPVYKTINGQLYREILNEDFDTNLNKNIWCDKYLRTWTKNEYLSEANYTINDSVLSLRIDKDTSPWNPDNDGDLRISGIQTGEKNRIT